MRDPDYRDRYQRRLSEIRAKYRRRTVLVFIMALVLGFLLGWIIYGMMDEQAGDANRIPAITQTADPTGTPAATWHDETEETNTPTADPAAETTNGPAVEGTDALGPNGFMGEVNGGSTETALAQESPAVTAETTDGTAAEPTAEATTETSMAPTAEATVETPAEPTVAPKGSISDPVRIGEPFSFTLQLKEDGTKRIEATENTYYDLPVTLTLMRYMLPDYYEEKYATQYKNTDEKAGVQLDVQLGAVDGLARISMQDAVDVIFQDANGQVVEGYQFTNAEIGGDSESMVEIGGDGTIYKRFKYDSTLDLKYLVVTYYYDAQPVDVYFSLTESVLPAETAEPEVSAAATPVLSDESYTIGSSGEGVKQLQQKLIDLGYLYGKPDGKYGNYTAEAVKEAQKAMGLEETGIADAAFIDALSKE